MKYLQESRKRIYFVAALLGMTLTFVPIAMAQHSFTYNEGGVGKSVNAVNGSPLTTFSINGTLLTSGTTRINLVGIGENDTFNYYSTNSTASVEFVATGSSLSYNLFNLLTTGNGNSTFSMISGPDSNFTIHQANENGTQTFAITGGLGSFVNESSIVSPASTYYSINLGDNSTVTLSSTFYGSATTVNVIF